MPKIKWSLKVNANVHNIELVHKYFSGKRKLILDEKILVDETMFKDTGSIYELKIENKKFKIEIKPNFLSWNYNLTEE